MAVIRRRTRLRPFVPALLLTCGWGCGIVGPTCVSRQESGRVTTLEGVAVPGRIVAHRLAYETDGSQNTLVISYPDPLPAYSPRIEAYVTRTSCSDFSPLRATNAGDCAAFAMAVPPANTLTITHGRGNPERLGSPPEYLLWTVTDAESPVRYSIDISWFHGPDC